MSQQIKREITRADLISMDEYGPSRARRRQEITRLKQNRRLGVGPHATFYFESYDTMWYQIHEMLWVEKGGEEQIEDEPGAYNPLIPSGRELTATLMFEINQRDVRQRILGQLGGIEDNIRMRFAGHTVQARPEDDMARSTPGGRASSVHFLHFPFTDEQIEAFRAPDAEVLLGFTHPKHEHTALMPDAIRQALCGDSELGRANGSALP